MTLLLFNTASPGGKSQTFQIWPKSYAGMEAELKKENEKNPNKNKTSPKADTETQLFSSLLVSSSKHDQCINLSAAQDVGSFPRDSNLLPSAWCKRKAAASGTKHCILDYPMFFFSLSIELSLFVVEMGEGNRHSRQEELQRRIAKTSSDHTQANAVTLWGIQWVLAKCLGMFPNRTRTTLMIAEVLFLSCLPFLNRQWRLMGELSKVLCMDPDWSLS